MRARPRWAAFLAAAAASVALGIGCSARTGPPRVQFGTACHTCGMPISDARFACIRGNGGRWIQYDSIECLLRDGPPRRGEEIYLSDSDRPALHAADSMWVVQGEFPSPMGGGFAALMVRADAEQVAKETRGRAGRLAEFARGATP